MSIERQTRKTEILRFYRLNITLIIAKWKRVGFVRLNGSNNWPAASCPYKNGHKLIECSFFVYSCTELAVLATLVKHYIVVFLIQKPKQPFQSKYWRVSIFRLFILIDITMEIWWREKVRDKFHKLYRNECASCFFHHRLKWRWKKFNHWMHSKLDDYVVYWKFLPEHYMQLITRNLWCAIDRFVRQFMRWQIQKDSFHTAIDYLFWVINELQPLLAIEKNKRPTQRSERVRERRSGQTMTEGKAKNIVIKCIKGRKNSNMEYKLLKTVIYCLTTTHIQKTRIIKYQ